MAMPSQDQINAALRYAGVAGGTIFTTVGLLAAIDPATTQAIVTNFHSLTDHLELVVGDLWKLGILIGPILAVWLAKIGVHSASPRSQLDAVEARPDITKIVTTSPAVAATHGDKVVTQ